MIEKLINIGRTIKKSFTGILIIHFNSGGIVGHKKYKVEK